MPFENSVQEFYLRETRNVYVDRKVRLLKIKTKKAAEAYVKDVRKKILASFNLPVKKTPLKPVFTGEQKCKGFTVKNLIYYSRPDYPVTAMLCIPDKVTKAKKAPGVLFLCGHAENGKASDVYQTVVLNLAAQGFVVLAIDPVSQGERHQFVKDKNKLAPKNCCGAHNMQGKQLYLDGEYFGAWRAWDAIRGIDFLQTLPEVDKTRIGVTGNSGGGTMTTFVSALDERVAFAAPSCYVTTWLHEVENELPADVEQMPPDVLKYGLDMSDFIIARAPRPTLIMGQKNDFFDPRGTEEAYEDAKAIYSLLGAEKNVKVHIGPDSHGYTESNRNAMYNFFNQHAFGTKKVIKEAPSVKPLPPEKTFAVPKKGEVTYLKGNKPLHDFILELADQKIALRKKLSKKELRKKLTDLLQIGKIEVPHYRKLRCVYGNLLPYNNISRFGLETEKDLVMCVMKLFSDGGNFHIPACDKAVLYVPNLDSAAEAPNVKLGKDEKLIGLDVRGVGELLPSSCEAFDGVFFANYRFDYHYASLGLMLGHPYLGGKVRDILCALELLKANGTKKVVLQGDGQGAVPALLAGVLSDIPVEVRLTHAPESWESMIRKTVTQWPVSCMLPGVLGLTDLPELCKFAPKVSCKIAAEPTDFKK